MASQLYKPVRKALVILGAVLCFYGLATSLAFVFPFPLPPADALVFYTTAITLRAGIPIYDYPAQVQWLAAQAGVPVDQIILHPYPYPPWYALSLLPLGIFSQAVATRAWFFMNCGMLFLAVWMLTDAWRTWQRALAEVAAFLFMPALGLLMVGQYDLPVLLGVVLFWRAMRVEESPALGAFGLALMTFKPHIGLFLLSGGLAWLLVKRYRRTLYLTVVAGFFLAAIGFIADPKWPLSYLQAVSYYRDVEGVQSCAICASLPAVLTRVFDGMLDIGLSAWISLPVGIILLFVFWGFRKRLVSLRFGISALLLAVLLSIPYVNNYDFVFLLVPLLLLWPQRRVWLGLAYSLPILMIVFGRDYNFVLPLAALITLSVLLSATIDLQTAPAYNTISLTGKVDE